MIDKKDLLKKAAEGIATLDINEKYKKTVLKNLREWLSEREEFLSYQPQIAYWIENKKWDTIIDAFFQIIPFGTGGRRGLVGIGTNRINLWAIKNSAQGHSQYLLKKHKDAKKRGIVITHGVRVFLDGKDYDPAISNPVLGLSARDLAYAAAEVYAANGLKVHFFKDYKTTPELSFAIRSLKAIGGAMIDASHNLPSDCGKKIYDSCGGQLIPPFDQELTDEVNKNVKKVLSMPFAVAQKKGLVKFVSVNQSAKYYNAVAKLSLSKERALKIVFVPLHGPGVTSIYPILTQVGFKVILDPLTSNMSGKFENVKFNIPNPEVEQSFENSLSFAMKRKADVILSSDPDADRIGIMARYKNGWYYFTGNEIAIILANFSIEKSKVKKGVIIKTEVTTGLVQKIAENNGVQCIGDLLVGYKYIAEEMNKLEAQGRMKSFIFGCEESHGYIAGNYVRDKDAALAALWLCELAAELKKKRKTLFDYLQGIYCQYGYCKNHLTEIRMLGAEGMEKINRIQKGLRTEKLKTFGQYEVSKMEDRLLGKPFLSATDKSSRDVLVFRLKKRSGKEIKITVRPSGTEPKIKFYIEIVNEACKEKELAGVIEESNLESQSLEKAFLSHCYELIGINFPERGYLLFWQLPLNKKMQYFSVENSIEKLKAIKGVRTRKEKLFALLGFLGSDPIEKIDKAFMAKYKLSVREYLRLS